MRRPKIALALGTCVAFIHQAAAADTVNGHYDPDGFTERVHSVRAVAHPSYLDLTVTRTVENNDDKTDEASLSIDVPEHAVAVGLRSQGMVSGNPVWFDGELLNADVAKSRYYFLTGHGQALPKDPAWLYWTSPTSLGLQVFPCSPHQPKTVEYRLRIPMDYADGRYTVQFPPLGTPNLPATIELIAENPRDHVLLNQHELSHGSQVKAPQNGENIEISLIPWQAEALNGQLAQVALGTGRSYVRAQLRARARISTIPKDARLLFAFDMSRSVGDSWQPEKQAFEAVVANFPDARIAAWGFDRALRPLTQGLITVASAKESIDALPNDTRNGSRVDLALQAIAEFITKNNLSPDKTRVFILSDAKIAQRVSASAVEAKIQALPAVTHLVEVTNGSCALDRNTELPWNHAVETTGGTSWNAVATTADEACSTVFEELARPKRFFINAVTLEGTSAEIEHPGTLDEGSQFVFEQLVSGSAKRLSFDAKLWGRPVTMSFATNRELSQVHGAMATANEQFDFTDPELQTLANHSHAVTRLTSYLAIEPGVRPSSEGISWGSGGMGSGIGLGTIGHGGGLGLTAAPDPFNHQTYLEEMVDRARVDCGVSYLRANVTIETTEAEIADIIRANVLDAPPSASGCLEEKIWSIKLPSKFRLPHAKYTIYR